MVVNCTEVVAREIPSVRMVAQQCKNHDEWEKKWRVIRRVFTAKNPFILASKRAGASVDLSGSASALQGLQSGSGAVGLSVGATASGIVNLSGEQGVVAIEMFRIGFFGGTVLEDIGSDKWFEDDRGDLLDDD